MPKQLITKDEISLRVRGESYHRTYPKGFKFNIISFTKEYPVPLFAKVILPDGKTHFLTLYENDYQDRKDWISRFDIIDN